MEELKPCPFCLSKATYIEKDTSHFRPPVINNLYDIGCTNDECYLSEGADYWMEKEMITILWNTRVKDN